MEKTIKATDLARSMGIEVIEIKAEAEMKKYSVLVEETLARNVTVEARDEEHADEIVQKLYDEEKIVLDSSDNNPDGFVLGGEYTEEAPEDAQLDF